MTPEAKIAALTAELAETRVVAAALVSQLAKAVATTPEQREKMALAYEAIADGKVRSRVTAALCRLVAERLRVG